jgi:hypothetical protein
MKELPGKNPEHHGIDQRRNRREFFGKTGAAAVAPGALSYEVLIQWQARDAPQKCGATAARTCLQCGTLV